MSTAPLGIVQELFGTTDDVSEKGMLLSVTVAEVVEVQPFVPVAVTV